MINHRNKDVRTAHAHSHTGTHTQRYTQTQPRTHAHPHVCKPHGRIQASTQKTTADTGTSGSSPCLQLPILHMLRLGIARGPVAQWIRHRPTEPGIAGSSPAGVKRSVLKLKLTITSQHISAKQTKAAAPSERTLKTPAAKSKTRYRSR